MYRNSAPCSQNPLQPECFSGKLAGTKACHPGSPDCLSSYSAVKPQLLSSLSRSGARSNENMNGSVSFSTLKPQDVPVDADFQVESLAAEGTCVDCSTVDQATFMSKCARDSNIASATLRLAPCSVKANRDVNQDQGNRQPDIIASRLNVAFNLTDAANAAPLAAAKAMQANNGMMLMHTGAPKAAGPAMPDKILGNMAPAISMPANAGLVGRL